MFDIKKFGAYISKLRKDTDMTQSTLADLLNVSRQSVSQYEMGDSFPDVTVLLKMSEIFKKSIDDLVKSGNPTNTEAILLKTDVKDKDNIPNTIFNQNITEDIVNIAPFLRPSLLEKIAEGLKMHDIDISNLVRLAEYLNDRSVVMLLENMSFDTLDKDLLERLVPFLNDEAKYKIFEKVLEGELDHSYIQIILPYAEYLINHIEAAVVYGALDNKVLEIIHDYVHNKSEK